MSEARALVAALARVSARSPRRPPPVAVTAARLALAALAGLAVAAPAAAEDVPTPVPDPLIWQPYDAAQPVGDETRFFCTAFRISKSQALTAGHCADLNHFPSTWYLHIDGHNYPAHLSAFSYRNGDDYAVLTADVGDDKPAWPDRWPTTALDCSGAVLPIGAAVRAEGYPQQVQADATTGGDLSVTWGRISGRPHATDPWPFPMIQTNLAVDHGSSGGPVFNDVTGKVIGILVGIDPNLPALSMSTPITVACAALHLS